MENGALCSWDKDELIGFGVNRSKDMVAAWPNMVKRCWLPSGWRLMLYVNFSPSSS